MVEYLTTKDKDVWIKFDPESPSKHERLRSISKPQLLTEKDLLLNEKKELPDGTSEAELLAWAIGHYPESESYLRRVQIDERIDAINADLEAMK